MSQLHPVPTTAVVPPQNLEAEEAVLGAMMISPGAITAVREIVAAGDFYRESHTRIYRAALALADAGEPVDAITLTDRLHERGELEAVGGRVRLHELAALVPATANAAHYAQIVRESSQMRELITIGGAIQRLGWDRPGDPAELLEQARGLVGQLDARTTGTTLDIETWAQFERSATEHVPTLVDDLWPVGGLGFIAAPPKKGKTWIGIDLAISVAAGVPFLGHFDIPTPQPVVLFALEGHRAAIRGRIGVLARGHGLNPDHGATDLQNLHIVYKPAGLNLNDAAWIRTVRDTTQHVGAQLLIVDVLRAAAVLKENSNDEFRDLIRALQPLQENGCALAMLHHFGKLTELTKDRTPGERMAGAGAMYGAFDVGIFITGSDDGARRLRVEFETRDVANPEPIGLHLTGDPTGKNGGFIYTDTAAWTVTDHTPDETDLTANATDVRDWLEQQPGRTATQAEIALAFEVDPRTIARRRPSYLRAGLEWEPARGPKPIRYWLPDTPTRQTVLGGHDKVDTCPPYDVSTLETPQMQGKHPKPKVDRTEVDNTPCPPPETPHLQAKPKVDKVDSPTESSDPMSGLALRAQDTTTTDPDADITW